MANPYAIANRRVKDLKAKIDRLEHDKKELLVKAGRAIINLPSDLRQEDWPEAVNILRGRAEASQANLTKACDILEMLADDSIFWGEASRRAVEFLSELKRQA